MKTKIFEGTLRNAIKQCVEEGYHWCNLKETYELIKKGKIENKYYYTSTLYFRGEFKSATKEQIKNIEAEYEKGARAVMLGGIDSRSGAYGGRYLGDYDARLVGVKK